MNDLRFAIFGTGFWSRFQLAAWRELEGAQCVALYNRTREKAERLGAEFGINKIYDDPERLLDEVDLDFVDIITDVDTHEKFSALAAQHGLPAICQKPMAPDLDTANRMLQAARRAGKPLFIHENWRWQRSMREFKRLLDSGAVNRPWRARVMYNSSFPVFENQPFLKELEQFILTDIGTHILDAVRFLFGEVDSLYCHTHRVNQEIKGEDAASVSMRMRSGIHVNCEMSYASRVPDESFPQTYLLVEGEDCSLSLSKDYVVTLQEKEKSTTWTFPPFSYAWADPAYDLIHASIVDCNRNLLSALRGEGEAETTAEDNYETLRLVYACYDSSDRNEVIRMRQFQR